MYKITHINDDIEEIQVIEDRGHCVGLASGVIVEKNNEKVSYFDKKEDAVKRKIEWLELDILDVKVELENMEKSFDEFKKKYTDAK